MERANMRSASYTTLTQSPTKSPSINLTPDLLPIKVSAVNNMINHLITDYQGNEKATEGYCRLVLIDNTVKDIFDELGSYQLKNSEAQLLSDLCRRLNEDPVLQEIRDSHLEERLTGECINRLPTLNIQNMSSLPGSPMRPKKSARMGHSRTTLDFMQPKVAEHEIPVLHAEDIRGSGTPTTANATTVQQEQDPIYVVANEEEIKKTEEMKIRNIHKLDVEIQEIVNHSLTRLETKKTENYQEQTEEELQKNIHEERKQYIRNLFVQMNDEYEKHRVEFAHKYYNEVMELSQSREYAEQKSFLTQLMEEYKVLMDDVDTNYKEVLKIIAELDDENGYELEKAKKNVAIKYKNLPAGGVSLKLEATVDVPLFNLLALNYEAEGFAKWTPFCKESKLIKRLGRASNAMWLKWDLPPPVSSREGYLIGSGFDRLDINGSILMIAKTIHKDPKLAERYGIDIPAKSKHVKMELPYIGVDLVPISKTQTKMRLVTTFDPQIKFVPLSLSSWIARKGSIFLLESMVKYAASLEGEAWKVYLERSKDFYDWLRNLLEEHGKI